MALLPSNSYTPQATFSKSGKDKQIVYNVRNYAGIDPAGITDSTTAIQNALNDAGVTGGIVVIPFGTYLISPPLLIKNNVTVEGDGYNTLLVRNSTDQHGILQLYDRFHSSSGFTSNVAIRNIHVDDKYATLTGFDCIAMLGGINIVVENCWVENAQFHGVEFQDITHGIIRNVTVTNCQARSIELDRSNTTAAYNCDDILIEKCTVTNGLDSGVELHKSGMMNITIRENYIDTVTGSAINVNKAAENIPQTSNINIIDNTLVNIGVPGTTGYGVDITHADTCTIDGNFISNCAYSPIIVSGKDSLTSAEINHGLTITNNKLEAGTTFTVSAGGTGYINNYNVSTTGGTGTGLTVDTIVAATLTVVSGGTGYTAHQNVATTGGSGTGMLVTTTVSGGVVTTAVIAVYGVGYTVGDTITITGGGANATCTLVGGSILDVLVNIGGSGYLSGDIVTITGGGANATLTLGYPGDVTILLSEVDGVIISGNRCEVGFAKDTGTPNIEATICQNVTVDDNRIKGGSTGIQFGVTSGTSMTLNCIASNNSINNCGLGITMKYQDGSIIYANNIYNYTSRGIYAIASDTNPVYIGFNNLTPSSIANDYPISFDGHNGSIVESNQITITNGDSSADGISLFAVSYAQVKGNNISGAGRSGVQIWGTTSDYNIVENNIITNSVVGIRQDNGAGTMTNTQIRNNNCYSNGTLDYKLTAGTFNAFNNIGLNPNVLYAIGNITGSTTITRVNGSIQTATLTGAVTLTLTAGINKGDILTLELSQDSTGSRVMTWPSNAKFGDGGTAVLTTTASAIDIITFVWDGSNWREQSRALSRVYSVAEGGTGNTSGQPSGSAGGDLTGTYPNPTIKASVSLTTPVLNVATATSINGLTLTSSTGVLTITNGKTLSVAKSLTLDGTDSTTMTFPTTSATIARTDAAQTFTGIQTFALEVETPQTITVSSNAGTADVNHGMQNFTNSSAATMAITLTTASAVDGQKKIIRIYDFSGVSQTIGWTGTENSTVAVPTTSNGSATLPLTVGFIFNSQTTKWRVVAVS